MATVLLAGCGSIGAALGIQLQTAGFSVIGLRRSAVAMPFPMLQADFTQPLDLPPLEGLVDGRWQVLDA